MFINIAWAEIQNNLSKTQDLPVSGSTYSVVQVFFGWLAVFVGIVGFVILITALFLYLLAAGDEHNMKKAHDATWGGVLCIVGAVIMYLIGRWLESNNY